MGVSTQPERSDTGLSPQGVIFREGWYGFCMDKEREFNAEGPITALVRERLRVYVQAEDVIVERVDPDDTMNKFEALEGHWDEVDAEYQRLKADDVILRELERRQDGQ